MLFHFTKDGQHGRFFSGKAQLSLNSDIVVIETDHLRSVPELLAVIVQIMIVHINQTMVKGDRSRQLEMINWGEPLILIDGDDEDQVAWAKSRPGKIVLVNGNPIELSNLLGLHVFFDQLGFFEYEV
ncbi:conjugal transfer protein TraC [Orientia tsutsugamushi]|uniref:Conjugal transfer protein TraC n=1 Tax=Orientia tsutsugamushi TaxID=784 RepID=A0A2U3QXU7_ORITS|nr:putative conjugative transfer protein TraC [Orientia tsutsugamushi str. UT76]SPR05752.1 conjugal transfer protein TraC [Orientia tsutsugamushi]